MTTSQDHRGAGRPPAEGSRVYFERPSSRRSATTVGVPRQGGPGLVRPDATHPRPLLSESDLPEAARTNFGQLHPAVATIAVIVGCYLLLAAAMIGSGLAVTHLLAHGSIGHWDEHVNDWFVAHRTTTWNGVSAAFTLLADTLGVVVVAAVVTIVLLIRRWGRFALLLLIGLAVELAVFLSTTYLVARPRPSAPHLGSTPSTFSWPSGHTAATLVLYGGIALLVTTATTWRFPRIVAWTIAVALTVGVALSRIYRGEHHPTDTVAGVILGVGALWAAVLAMRAASGAPPHSAHPASRHQAPAGTESPSKPGMVH